MDEHIVKFAENGLFYIGDELVRCKDCKFKYCGDSMKKYGVPDDILWCYWLDTEPDDYCSFGERKEE